jgi:predicted PurR-regulated permease PerM
MNLWEIYFTMELFFAAILMGYVVSLVISYFFSFFSLKTEYELELEWVKREKNENEQKKFEYFNKRIAVPFWGYLIVIILFAFILAYSFIVFADITNKVKNIENVDGNASVACINNITIINNYNLTVNQITTGNQHQEISIKDLQYLMNRR